MVTGVQTCALPISSVAVAAASAATVATIRDAIIKKTYKLCIAGSMF